jgi:hypothetical protein
MSTLYRGQTTGAIFQIAQPYTLAPDGQGSASLTFKIAGSVQSNLSIIPEYLDPHPYITGLLAFESVTDQEEGPVTVCTTTYKGVAASDPEELAQVEFSKSTSEAPVETHPRFSLPRERPPVTAQDIASIELSLQNNAPPDPNLSKEAMSLYDLKRRGIESYLKPGQVFKRVYVSPDIPSGALIDDVGKIKQPPSPAPDAPKDQNYLYLGVSWVKQAGVVTITEEYQLSGPGGWNPTLYETA